MRNAIGFPALLLAATFIANAQQPAKPATKTLARPAAHAEAAPAASQLPVTRVSLYKNGVGFFEHSGHVTGDQSVTIDFTTAQLNDVLQSLTAIDLNGGRIAGAGYNSTTPLEQQLQSLPLGLGEDPTAVDFYNAIRGARVEVHSLSTSTGVPGERSLLAGVTITGRLLNIEVTQAPGKDNQPATEKRLITVIGDAGEIRTMELNPTTEVRLLDSGLHTDVTRYLELLASTRNQGLRHLTLQDNGSGARELHVSYISEVPIWKSTYRILFTNPKSGADPTRQTATLQGWSVVDNTTGADWINVQLSLIAGAPQSFIQPLSIPYYSRRPEIGLPQEAQLSPQTHESGEFAPSQNASAQVITGAAMASGSGSGLGPGLGGNYGGGLRKVGAGVSADQSITVQNETYSALPLAPPAPSYQTAAASSFAVNKATTAAFDDYFAYNLTEPITIRKNESAMVPILQTKVDAERVTLWSQRQPTPLRALWVTNTSNLTLDRGSFTIVEDGNFGGEGLLDPIHPAEKRLLSYAVDQAVRVTAASRTPSTRITRFVVANGWLRQISVDSRSVEYTVHNAATEPRTVIVEHPLTTGWTLDSTSAKPVETTSTVNRYSVVAQPNGSAVIHLDESRIYDQNWHLIETGDAQFNIILHNAQPSPALLAALQPILDARRHVAGMQEALDKVKARLATLHSDEERQRSNITALASADKSSRDRFVRDLNATEDQIAAAQKDLATAQTSLQAAKDDLANKIESLQINETL